MWVSSNHPMVAFSKGEEGVWPCSGVYWGDVKVGDVGRMAYPLTSYGVCILRLTTSCFLGCMWLFPLQS